MLTLFDKLKMMGCNIMTLYLLGLTICKIVGRARTLKASWRWLSLAKNGDFLIGHGNILLNLGGEGVPLLTKIDAVCRTLQVRTPCYSFLAGPGELTQK